MKVEDNFIETEIAKMLLILEKYCKTFNVDGKSLEVKVNQEDEKKHVNG